MKLLSISTSAKIPSVALLLYDDRIVMRSDTSARPHSVSLMPLVDELLCTEGLDPSGIDAFCVDIGPGSFTGVRIGVSVVNALALATGKPIVAVSSLAALRHFAPSDNKIVCCMLDARGGNGYAAAYNGDVVLVEPCACVQSEIIEMLGREYGEFSIIGDCFGGSAQVDASLVLKEAVHRLSINGETTFTSSAVPMYLRPSQAERMKAGK